MFPNKLFLVANADEGKQLFFFSAIVIGMRVQYIYIYIYTQGYQYYVHGNSFLYLTFPVLPMCVIQYAVTWTGSFTSLFSRILKMFCSFTSQESKCSPMDTKKKTIFTHIPCTGYIHEWIVGCAKWLQPPDSTGWAQRVIGVVPGNCNIFVGYDTLTTQCHIYYLLHPFHFVL